MRRTSVAFRCLIDTDLQMFIMYEHHICSLSFTVDVVPPKGYIQSLGLGSESLIKTRTITSFK